MLRNFLVAIILLQIFEANGEDMGFKFEGFGANISVDGAAAITTDGLLRLTSITTYNQIGHAFYYRPLPFKDSSTNSSLSFSTNFVIQLVPKSPDYSGNGMAFVISPTKDLSGGQAGGYLGFLNSADNGNSSNHVVAIEFDTVPNPEHQDPDFNHVGIDVNSLTSFNLSQAGYYSDVDGKFVALSLWSGKPIQVWVDYNAKKTRLSVTISPFDVSKPSRPLVSSSIDLSTVLLDFMYLGFSASINYVQTSHYVLGWSFKVNGQADQLDLKNLPIAPAFSETSSKKSNYIVPVVISIVVVVILFIVAGIVFIVVRRNRHNLHEDPEIAHRPRRFSYDELRKATNAFSEDNFLGQGGSGKVYKGLIPNSNNQVAVKVILHDSDLRMKEFHSEITTVGRIRHQHLVRLQGYSERRRELMLVYDFVTNGSLERFLYGNAQLTLVWTLRLQIINQVASALCFLHQYLGQMVVHRDIKASNVLLDADFNAKLGDFGLSRLYDHGIADPQTTRPAGTIGYIAPEARTGTVSPKADVYAFGVLMLEIACGRRPIDLDQSPGKVILKDWVTECYSSDRIFDVVDPRLGEDYDKEEMGLVLKLGLICSSHSTGFRPNMQEVMQYLHGHRIREFTADDLKPEHPRQEEDGDTPNAPNMSPSTDSLTNFYSGT